MIADQVLLHPHVRDYVSLNNIACETLACDPALADTAAFCAHYNVSPGQAANAIIVIGKTTPLRHACCLVLATCKLDVNKKVAHLLGVKRCSFATAEQTIEVTGMEIGGVTPFGLPDMPVYIDSRVMEQEKVVIGGGNRSSKLLLPPSEIARIINAQVVPDLAVPR